MRRSHVISSVLLLLFAGLCFVFGSDPPPEAARKAIPRPPIPNPESMGLLFKQLHEVIRDVNATPAERRAAAATLKKIAQNASNSALVLALHGPNDPDPEVRLQCLEAIQALGPIARSSAPYLMDSLTDKSLLVRRQAIATLGAVFADSHLSPNQHKYLKLVPRLLTILKGDEDFRSRELACGAIANLGSYAKDAVPTLIEIAQDPRQGTLRLNAAWAIVRIGPEAKAAVPFFLNLIKNRTEDYNLSDLALRSLGLIGAEYKVGMPLLLASLEESYKPPINVSRRLVAIQGIASYGPIAKDAVPALVRVLESDDIADPMTASRVRRQVLSTLSFNIGAENAAVAAPAIQRIADNANDPGVKDAARRFLKEIAKQRD